jgi:Raf kinase inhibitor-like YbhB/YbcL family protein
LAANIIWVEHCIVLLGEIILATFPLSSPAFTNDDWIPIKHTCDGTNLSPVLHWGIVPNGTRSLALIVDDPDAPFGIFVHWVLYNMPSSLSELPEGVPQMASVREIGTQGTNGFQRVGYNGPCPPRGTAHRYFFKLYALDLEAKLPSDFTADRLMKMIRGHILAEAQIMGKYQRK